MTKKSVEILGLPVISITEGRELGISKTLIIDANAGAVGAITIEDEDWYRGVKLLPYSSVIAIGRDAVTVTSSNSILTLEESSDFEAMLDSNIRIIGTKAITKTGTINGKVNEIFISDDGMVEKIQIVAPDGSESEISADEISIFGKQVTVIGDPGDGAHREKPAFESAKVEPVPAPESESEPAPMPEPTPVMAAPEPVQEIEPAPATAADAPEATVEATPKSEPTPAAEPEPEGEKNAPKPKKTTATRAKKTAKTESEPENPAANDNKSMDRHRRFLLGKKATRDIVAAGSAVVIKAGEEITEATLQKAQLAGKLIELSMNAQ